MSTERIPFNTSFEIFFAGPVKNIEFFADHVKKYFSENKPGWLKGLDKVEFVADGMMFKLSLNAEFDIAPEDKGDQWSPPVPAQIDAFEPTEETVRDFFIDCFKAYSGPELVCDDGTVLTVSDFEDSICYGEFDPAFDVYANEDTLWDIVNDYFCDYYEGKSFNLVVKKILEGSSVRSALLE